MMAVAADLESMRTSRAKLVEPSDACSCKCCSSEPPTRCARVLVLSPRDTSDAARVLAIAGEQAGHRVVPSAQISSVRSGERAEPTSEVRCRACRRPFAIFAFIAEVLTNHHLTIECEACR